MSLSEAVVPVRIGIVGLGRAGMFHFERIGLREDLNVVSLFDDCQAARERARVESAVMHATWDEFLKDPGSEAVLLATPPASHAELALAALAAGKNVIVETPICLSLAEVDAVVSAARRTGRSVSVAQTRRWNDDFLTALGVLQSGAIGRLRTIKFVNWQYAPHAGNGKSPQDPPGRLSRGASRRELLALAPHHRGRRRLGIWRSPFRSTAAIGRSADEIGLCAVVR